MPLHKEISHQLVWHKMQPFQVEDGELCYVEDRNNLDEQHDFQDKNILKILSKNYDNFPLHNSFLIKDYLNCFLNA